MSPKKALFGTFVLIAFFVLLTGCQEQPHPVYPFKCFLGDDWTPSWPDFVRQAEKLERVNGGCAKFPFDQDTALVMAYLVRRGDMYPNEQIKKYFSATFTEMRGYYWLWFFRASLRETSALRPDAIEVSLRFRVARSEGKQPIVFVATHQACDSDYIIPGKPVPVFGFVITRFGFDFRELTATEIPRETMPGPDSRSSGDTIRN